MEVNVDYILLLLIYVYTQTNCWDATTYYREGRVCFRRWTLAEYMWTSVRHRDIYFNVAERHQLKVSGLVCQEMQTVTIDQYAETKLDLIPSHARPVCTPSPYKHTHTQ